MEDVRMGELMDVAVVERLFQPPAEAVVLGLPPHLVPGHLLGQLLQGLTHALGLRKAQRGHAAQGRRGQLHRA
eukprot:2317128-Pyramimonas_sp.AAC.1